MAAHAPNPTTIHQFRALLRMELNRRFSGSALGLVWTAILPLLQLALFALVFVHIFGARDSGLPGVGYLEFLALGMWPWLAFSDATGRAGGALVEDAGLMAKVRISPVQLVAARVLVAFALHFAGFLLVLLTLALLGVRLHPQALVWVLPGWALLLVTAGAAGMIVALIQLFVRDLQQLMPQLLTALLFLSPILYPVSLAPSWLQGWFALNPIGGAIDMIRNSVLVGAAPRLHLLPFLAVIAILALMAVAMYRRLRAHLEDWL